MVKKLFKHEFIAYGRIMVIIYTIVLTIAAASRLLMAFESDTVAYNIISAMCMLVYFVSAFASFVFAFAMILIRFYKNLFTAEGYLSFTLPVTATQHILVKAVTAVCVSLITWIIFLLSGCILAAGEPLVEIGKGMGEIIAGLYDLAGFHSVLIGGEFVILLLTVSFSNILLYYTFISIGQLFKKNRILAAVGAYFVYYIILQIVLTVFTIHIALFSEAQGVMDLALWIWNHPYTAIHIGMWGCILLSALFAAVEFIVIRAIITKKLNLE